MYIPFNMMSMGGDGIPFAFESDGFFPGGLSGMGGDRRSSQVDNDKLYQILGVSKSASSAEIRKAYKKLALIHHPDKSGDPQKFKEISRAYNILGDETKRRKYDKYGESGIDGDDFDVDPTSIFQAFFGGGSMSGSNRAKRTPDIRHTLKVPLNILYTGGSRKLRITRKVLDPKSENRTCSDCDGAGVVTRVVQYGNMLQQTRSECRACQGRGRFCKFLEQKSELVVEIPKGCSDDYEVSFSNMADELPDHETGSMFVKIQAAKHPDFEKVGTDLIIERKVNLREALVGFAMVIPHIRGEDFVLTSDTPLQINKERKAILTCPNWGMPKEPSGRICGDLAVIITVEMPKDIPQADLDKLLSVFPIKRLNNEESEISVSATSLNVCQSIKEQIFHFRHFAEEEDVPEAQPCATM